MTKKAVISLLGFFKTINIEAREKAMEREVEWRQINDQVDENLLR